MIEAIPSSETSVLTRATRRDILEDGIPLSHCRENFKFSTILILSISLYPCLLSCFFLLMDFILIHKNPHHISLISILIMSTNLHPRLLSYLFLSPCGLHPDPNVSTP
jgi:hypothetical protein